MYYLISNWSSGIFNNCKYTSNGLEVEYTTNSVSSGSYGITVSSPAIKINALGKKISLSNTTSADVIATVSGSYDNLDSRIEYLVAIASDNSSEASYNSLDPKYHIASTARGYGTIGFNFSVRIPANKQVFLLASSGQYLPLDRFYVQRSSPSDAYYITETLRLKKSEDVNSMFMPLAEAYDLSNPKLSVNVKIEIAVFSTSDHDPNSAVWKPVTAAASLINKSTPYFRFKVTFPPGKLVAISKIGYAIASNFAYTEPVNLMTTSADVEFTVYRPNFKVFIGSKDYTRYVESCNSGSITMNIRKVDEDFTPFYYQKVSIYLDGTVVDGGVITRLTKVEYPNAVTYGVTYTSYRDLLGASYIDNAFAFNSAKIDINNLPFANEFEFINYVINYSPASNGVIINTQFPKEFRSLKLWSDDFNQVNKTGGMGFANSPDRWTQFYIGNQKLGLEVIEQVANANQLTAEVTHAGNVILSDLIPHKDKTLHFGADYHNDQTSILSVCTHRYNDYSDNHTYIPDYRLHIPDVSYDALQSGALVHVNGTSGLGQTVMNPTEQYIGVIKGFDTGKPEYEAPGNPYKYSTQLTYSHPREKVSFTFAANNQKTNTVEQTALGGSPKIEGLENVTYTSNAGNVIQPTILDAAHGVKLEHRWINGTLGYKQDTEDDDVYGITQLAMEIWTDDLKDEPVRQAGIGLAVGIGAALLIGALIFFAGPAAIPVVGGLFSAGAAAATGAAAGVYWGALVGVGAVAGAALGTVSGTSSKVDIMLPIKVKGVPLIKAHQEDFVETHLVGIPNPKYFPKWAESAYQEVLRNKEALGTETKIVNNPYVVNLSGYKKPKQSKNETDKEFAFRSANHIYREDLAEVVASGLTLQEWMKGREVSLRYVGNPGWFPHQFIAIAKQPTRAQDGKVYAYEYFYTLGAQSTSINVGGEVNTEIKAAYIGTGFLNGVEKNTDIRGMNLLGD